MRRVVCHDCGKRYDFDAEDFCPKCGAFNPPRKTWDVDAKGNVIRVDGINERNHAGSFVHKEVHAEKASRRTAGLDNRTIKPARKKPVRGTAYRTGMGNLVKKLIIAAIAIIAVVVELLTK